MDETAMVNQNMGGALARNLQFLRKQKDLSQEALAEQLGVSRQSISKWESGAAWPEMATLLALCEIFGVDLDTLARGSAERAAAADTAGYDAHMNAFAKAMAAGVALVLAGVAFLLAFEGLRLYFIWDQALGGAGVGGFMLFVLLAAVLFIVYGIQHADFCKKHPRLEPFYTPAQIDRYNQRFVWLIAGPVAVLLAGVILLVVAGSLFESRGLGLSYSCWLVALFLLIVGGCAAVLTWAGIQKSKYDLEAYNRGNAPTPAGKKQEAFIGAVCGTIMLAATALYVGLAAADGSPYAWRQLWWLFAVGGIACGAAVLVIDAFFQNRRK